MPAYKPENANCQGRWPKCERNSPVSGGVIATEKYGIQTGSIVTRKGMSYRVVRLEGLSSQGKPWVVGNPQLQDGSYGTAEHHLFDDWGVAT